MSRKKGCYKKTVLLRDETLNQDCKKRAKRGSKTTSHRDDRVEKKGMASPEEKKIEKGDNPTQRRKKSSQLKSPNPTRTGLEGQEYKKKKKKTTARGTGWRHHTSPEASW